MTALRVCYLGAYDPVYPRNLILRRGLELNGAQVIECRVSPKLNTRQRANELGKRFRQIADQSGVILLAEFNQSLAPFVWWLARRSGKWFVIDAFTSIYDSAVHDRGVARPGSLPALRYWLIDWLALRLADLVLVDTTQHADYFASTFGMSRRKLRVIPVGASREWFETPISPHPHQGLLVQFYGTYIPLHGIDTILHTAHHLADHPDIRFQIIGRGQTYKQMQALATTLELKNVDFLDSVPPSDLPALIAQSDISLGIFGTTDKAKRVVPNKVYQTLALGKPVITADSPALREMFTPDYHLIATPPGDPTALANAITMLASDPIKRAALGNAGHTCMEAEFNENALGRKLLEALA